MGIGKHLHLDVARTVDAFLHVDLGASEGLAGLRQHALVLTPEHVFGFAAADTAAAAARGGLEHDRVADRSGKRHGLVDTRQAAVAAGYDRHPRGLHGRPRGDLVAHLANDLGAGPDIADVAAPADLGKQRVLRQETVPRVQRIAAGGDGQVHDTVGVQVAGDRIRADVVGFIGLLDVQGMAVRVGIDGHGGDAGLGTGADDAHGDLAAVGDQDLANQLIFREVMAMGCSLRRIPVPFRI